jgi:hypothetical protein
MFTECSLNVYCAVLQVAAAEVAADGVKGSATVCIVHINTKKVLVCWEPHLNACCTSDLEETTLLLCEF